MLRASVLWIFLIFFALLASAVTSLDLRDPRWRWMDEQINEDFQIFNAGITESMLDETMRKVPEIGFGNALVRLKVIQGRVYGKEGMAKNLLQKIVELYPLPNLDIIVHEQDIIWNWWVLSGPVLATCKIKNGTHKMIHFPVQLVDFWENECVPEVEKGAAHWPWEAKIPKIFWRGLNNDADNYNNRADWTKLRRGKLCYLSQQFPALIDASFSYSQSWLVSPELQPEFFRFFPLKRASWDEYLNHKYLICLDGYVASTPGCAWKLLSNCTVFKHDSAFTLYFYRCLIPWIHYVPVNSDLSDLLEKIEWAKNHDAEAHQIAENGRKFAQENIMPEHLYLYCYKVLLKYASLQRFAPSLP